MQEKEQNAPEKAEQKMQEQEPVKGEQVRQVSPAPKKRATRKKKDVNEGATPEPLQTAEAQTAQAQASEAQATEVQAQETAHSKESETSAAAPKSPVARKRPAGAGKTTAQKATALKSALANQAESVRAGEQPREESAAMPLLHAPNDKLPVKAQTQRGVEIAVPPVNLAALGEQRRNFWGRVILLLAVSVVLALSILIFLYRPTVYSTRTHSIRFLYNGAQDKTLVLYDGEPCEETLQGEWTQGMYDTTGSVCAAVVGGKLYAVQGDEIEEISPTVQDFLLSQNGRVLVYRNAENQLHYVNLVGGNESYTISRDSRDAHYCLSPDGKTLFYTYVSEEAGVAKTHATIFSISGDKPFFQTTTGIVPVAVADDFEHIFYFDANGDLYYMNEDSEISLCRRYAQGGMELLFDREFEEVLIRDAKGMMLWQNGKETMIPQLKSGETLTLLPNQRADFRELAVGAQWLIRSFDDNYYLKKGADADGARLSYLEKGTLTEVAFISEAQSKPVVTDKGVFYLEHVVSQDGVRKHLYICPSGKTVAEKLSWDVEDFCVNSDGSRILHVDHQGWLYAAHVSGTQLDSEFISDYVDEGLLDSSATDIFYYFVDGTLYVSNNGEKPKQAFSTEIDALFLDAHTAILCDVQQGSFTIYTKHRNRSKMLEIASGITSIH